MVISLPFLRITFHRRNGQAICDRQMNVVRVPPSLQVDSYVMVGDAFVPVAQGPAGLCLYDGDLVVIPGKGTDRVQAGEEGDGGEHDLVAIVATKQAGAA